MDWDGARRWRMPAQPGGEPVARPTLATLTGTSKRRGAEFQNSTSSCVYLKQLHF